MVRRQWKDLMPKLRAAEHDRSMAFERHVVDEPDGTHLCSDQGDGTVHSGPVTQGRKRFWISYTEIVRDNPWFCGENGERGIPRRFYRSAERHIPCGFQRLIDTHGLRTFSDAQSQVPRTEGQSIRSAHLGAGNDLLGPAIKISHRSDDGQLLPVMLAT